MSEENSSPYRTYLLRCWREGSPALTAESVWRFSIEEILGQRRRRGFGSLKEVVAFLQAELTAAGSPPPPESSVGQAQNSSNRREEVTVGERETDFRRRIMVNESYRFKLGDFECVAISDGSMDYPLQNFFTNVPREQVEAVLRQRNLTTEHVTTPYTCLFVNTGEHNVMVDTGSGHNLGPSAGKLLKNMKAAGLEPADIDTVIITHAHPDHVGGNLNDEGKLNFANAQYFIWKREWDFWMSERALEMAPEFHVKVARMNLEPIQQQLDFVDQEIEIVPGIRALAAPGHTPGHMALSIVSGDDRLLHISDTVLYPLHLEQPDWLPVFDILPDEAATSKHRIFDQAAAEKLLVFAHHFPPFPNLGYVVQKGEAWQWRPLAVS